MEKQNWSLIFLALCLVLAFSVSPVEAGQKQKAECGNEICEGGEKKKCPADCNAGGGDEGGDVSMYGVTIEGAVSGQSDPSWPWIGPFPSEKRIGLGQYDVEEIGDIGELDLSFFVEDETTPFDGNRGENCFGSNPQMVPLHPQAIIKKGRGGRAESSFWFEGCNGEERGGASCANDVLYVLKMFGLFVSTHDWPPTSTTEMGMTDWAIEREGQAFNACLAEGSFNQDVNITVIKEEPPEPPE